MSKKDRVPSYCDRILYKDTKEEFFECKSLSYNFVSTLKQSDHRPVHASFLIKTINWENSRPHVAFLDIVANSDQNLDITYEVSHLSTTHLRDWIGVYQVCLIVKTI